MARGRLLRTKVKETLAIERARVRANFLEINRLKGTNKGFFISLREHIGKAIDKIDPLEAVSVAGLTVTIHQLIMNNETWLAQTTVWNIPVTIGAFEAFARAMGGRIVDLSQVDKSEIGVWVSSFVIAFIVVRHAGQLIGGISKGLTTIIPFILGLA